MRMNETKSIPVVVCQASCDHLTIRETPCGSPVPTTRWKLDTLVGAEVSCPTPIDRPLVLFSTLLFISISAPMLVMLLA